MRSFLHQEVRPWALPAAVSICHSGIAINKEADRCTSKHNKQTQHPGNMLEPGGYVSRPATMLTRQYLLVKGRGFASLTIVYINLKTTLR